MDAGIRYYIRIRICKLQFGKLGNAQETSMGNNVIRESKKFIVEIGADINNLDDIYEKVTVYLQTKGFGKSYELTKDGAICESILDEIEA